MNINKLKKICLLTTGGFLAVLVSLALVYLCLRSNIHTVVPNKVYRSAQLDSKQFASLIRAHHIKAILNLRGANPRDKWYQHEVQLSARLNVKHYDLKMYAHKLPRLATLKQLVNLLANAPRPLLIHCQGGADRTGLASAVVILLNNGSVAAAKEQVSIRYFALSSTSVGRLVLPIYQHWLKQKQRSSTAKLFLAWLAKANLRGV